MASQAGGQGAGRAVCWLDCGRPSRAIRPWLGCRCPPGHGDIYPSLLGSGMLDRLIAGGWAGGLEGAAALLGACCADGAQRAGTTTASPSNRVPCCASPPPTHTDGITYLFVSNSDNLGATLDTSLLAHFAGTGAGFLMEVRERWAWAAWAPHGRYQDAFVADSHSPCLPPLTRPVLPCPAPRPCTRARRPQVCERTASDKKGGHLARRKRDGRLMLRESAMCPDADKGRFEDITV